MANAMIAMTHVVSTFPTAKLLSKSGGLPVEVSLIAQLGIGSGNHLFESVVARQKAHAAFVDELDEPSAKLAGTNFAQDDATSLYSFIVGANGHPFHRHAGHRVFTAVSGSGGAQLRFSSASPAQIEADPQSFFAALQYINIPPDSLFTVRFGGDTWHQFAPAQPHLNHPAFFALSCHTNELGGALAPALREKVIANNADIPSLTELLPQSVATLLQQNTFDQTKIPTTSLSLDAPAGSVQSAVCRTTRGTAGTLRGAWSRWRGTTGFTTDTGVNMVVTALKAAPIDSLLQSQFAGEKFHHDDTFCLVLDNAIEAKKGADVLLAAALEGFMENSPSNVARLMAFRNTLVKPIGLRTSPLGCPVSSLLSPKRDNLFAHRFPVLAQAGNADNSFAQVILGADDKHLKFRSCVSVKILGAGKIEYTLGTRVQCSNLFGRFYMAAIDHAHRNYVTPSMLRMAVEYATQPAAVKPANKLVNLVAASPIK